MRWEFSSNLNRLLKDLLTPKISGFPAFSASHNGAMRLRRATFNPMFTMRRGCCDTRAMPRRGV